MSCAHKMRPRAEVLKQDSGVSPEQFIFPGSDLIRRPPSQPSLKEDLREKRKQTAVKYLRKILQNKLRSNFKDLKANAWTYYNYRQQKRMKSNLMLFKVLSLLNEKMKSNKFQAMSKLKEAFYSQRLENSQSSKTNISSGGHNDGPTPSTALNSFQTSGEPISKQMLKGAKLLANILDQKLLDRKLSFWLPLRASGNQMDSMIKKLRIDFGEKVF